ncbi:MAG: hypothetical protein KDJ97_37130 [Anaerolineae bacterium]|nr:hypothetical protein [Anaerolineae bacterium]
MSIKQVLYDARSLNPTVGDTVTVLIQHHDQDIETLEAIYLGADQVYSYTTPYFKFLEKGNRVRLINANAVKEWQFTIAQPGFAPQLANGDENDYGV